jgi:hypothetical protein
MRRWGVTCTLGEVGHMGLLARIGSNLNDHVIGSYCG